MSNQKNSPEDSQLVPLERLKTTDEYQRLTKKQKLFVATYIHCGVENGVYDSVVATQTAYHCKTLEIARVLSYALMNSLRVIAVLNLHFGREPLAVFLEAVDRAIKNKKLSIAQFKALQLKAQLLGFQSRLPGADERASSVIPPDVIDAEKEAKKRNRKSRSPAPEVTNG